MRSLLAISVALSVAVSASACPVGNVGTSAAELKKLRESLKAQAAKRGVAAVKGAVRELPTAFSAQPWGGSEPSKWRPEAILANAGSRALNEAFAIKEVTNAAVSIPVVMEHFGAEERVYGDGQTNAAVGFGAWLEKRPPLVATLVRLSSGARKIYFRFAPAAVGASRAMTIRYRLGAKETTKIVALARVGGAANADATNGAGADATAEWLVPTALEFGDLLENHAIWIQAAEVAGAYPLDFRMPIATVADLKAEAGDARTLGKTPIDPIDVSARSKAAGVVPLQTLLDGAYGSDWHHADDGSLPLVITSVHGGVHRGGHLVATAVGAGNTWLIDKGANSTFKSLYTCFGARDFGAESKLGVPSGGGWHEIGDAAETIINDVEQDSVLVGFASGAPAVASENGFAFGLSDVATMRLLRPGEALMTSAGNQTWKEDENWRARAGADQRGKGPGAARNFHWFIFDTESPVCTQEWVHNCRPGDVSGDRYGLRCK